MRAVPLWALLVSVLCAASSPAAENAPARGTENAALPALTSDELTTAAQALFEAVVQGVPALGDPFFFPKEPFIPLKDVHDPAKYYAGLLAEYHHDIRDLHAARRNWAGATFRSFTLGTVPRWVKPGEEWNKIGYHRTYRAKLEYEIAGKVRTLEVHTIISWDGRWYVTHLAPIRHESRGAPPKG
jgi:hypothetical protein